MLWLRVNCWPQTVQCPEIWNIVFTASFFETAAWQQMGEKCLLLGTFCLYFIHVYCTDAKWLEQMWAAVFDLFVDSVSVLFFIVLLLEWIQMETFILNVFNKYALCPTCSVRDEIHCTEIHSTYVKQNNKPFFKFTGKSWNMSPINKNVPDFYKHLNKLDLLSVETFEIRL